MYYIFQYIDFSTQVSQQFSNNDSTKPEYLDRIKSKHTQNPIQTTTSQANCTVRKDRRTTVGVSRIITIGSRQSSVRWNFTEITNTHIIQHDTQSGGNYVTHSGAQITKQLPVVVTRGPKVGRHSVSSRLAVTPRSLLRLSLGFRDFRRFFVGWLLSWGLFRGFQCENFVFLCSFGVFFLKVCVRWRFCGGLFCDVYLNIWYRYCFFM